jgi:hypothetical protein
MCPVPGASVRPDENIEVYPLVAKILSPKIGLPLDSDGALARQIVRP